MLMLHKDVNAQKTATDLLLKSGYDGKCQVMCISPVKEEKQKNHCPWSFLDQK